jgi:hypothetical protein
LSKQKTTPKTLTLAQHHSALAGRAFNRPRLETLKETALKAAIAAEESEDDDGHKKADRKKLLQQTTRP